MTPTSPAGRFHLLFAGLERAYGLYSLESSTTPNGAGKLAGKATTYSENVTVTDALWESHLTGKSGLGIVPIREDSTAVFGSIDIDVYDELDHTAIAAGLHQQGLPLVTIRSKSGGAHLFLFVKTPVPAARIIAYLKEVAASIGHGKCEVFPKQSFIEAASVGNWLNMPYQGGSTTTRYAVRPDGSRMSMEEFLDYAEAAKVDAAVLSKPLTPTTDFHDGPPCLHAIAASGGCPSGARNNGLFAIGVYLRKSQPDNYGVLLDEYNQRHMRPPLPSEEVVQIKKSVSRKNYGYKCQEEPLISHCNAGVCRLRKYGIGGDRTPMPQFGTLKKLETDPPSYSWELDGKPVALSIDELLSYTAFSRAVAMRLNKLMPPLKPAQWRESLAAAMEAMEIIPMPEDASPDGQLWEHVKRFCNGRIQAMSLEDVMMGKPFKSDGFFYVRIADIVNHLGRSHIKAPPPQEIAASLRRRGGKHQAKKLKGQSVNLWLLPADGIEPEKGTDESLAVPESITKDQQPF